MGFDMGVWSVVFVYPITIIEVMDFEKNTWDFHSRQDRDCVRVWVLVRVQM